jgi:hypothetical protein
MAAHHRSQLIANAAPRRSPLRFFVLVFRVEGFDGVMRLLMRALD